MKRIDLLIGLKSEQSLRDALRERLERSPERGVLELVPVGKKDWIAGQRMGQVLTLAALEAAVMPTMQGLVALGSHQRIRQDSLRVFSVREPVPVFKDGSADDLLERALEERPPEPTTSKTMVCPVCHSEVHRYNIQYDPSGKIVGCYLCRGERGTPGR